MFNTTTSGKFIAPRRQGAKLRIYFGFSELGVFASLRESQFFRSLFDPKFQIFLVSTFKSNCCPKVTQIWQRGKNKSLTLFNQSCNERYISVKSLQFWHGCMDAFADVRRHSSASIAEVSVLTLVMLSPVKAQIVLLGLSSKRYTAMTGSAKAPFDIA